MMPDKTKTEIPPPVPDDAAAAALKRVFITFHSPAFATTGAGAIPADQNPHRYIAPFAASLEIIVFNGHVHTTEAFKKDE